MVCYLLINNKNSFLKVILQKYEFLIKLLLKIMNLNSIQINNLISS